MKQTGRLLPIGATSTACLVFGLIGSAIALRHYGAPRHGLDARAFLVGAGLAPLCLAGNLCLRFFRWHLILRGMGIYLPERASLRIYLGSFAFNFTPLFLGPTLFRVFALRKSLPGQAAGRHVLGASLAEGFYDASGLALIGLIAALLLRDPPSAIAPGVILLASALPAARKVLSVAYCALVNVVARGLGRDPAPLPEHAYRRVFSPPRYVSALLLTTLAWLFPVLLLYSLADSSAGSRSPLKTALAVVEGSLYGPLSLSPAGAGVSGNIMLRRLDSEGVPVATEAMILYRLGTLWLSILAGALVLLWGRAAVLAAAPRQETHFHELSDAYDAQIPGALRERLLRRKTTIMLAGMEAMGMRPDGGRRGLDIGCGQGHHARFLAQAGFTMVGIDAAPGQATGARGRIQRVALADAEKIPFRDGAFDFIYAINILHHLPDRAAQRRAFAGIQRLLAPDGVFFLHEINTTNPLFRFYMGYVFPLIRDIDVGSEAWIRPGDCGTAFSVRPARIEFYTFLPDFLPTWAARILGPLERALERSRLARYSAHYTAVIRKGDFGPDPMRRSA